MSLGIRHKLIIAFAAIALLVTLIAFVAMLYSFRAGFLQYLNDIRYSSLVQLSQTITEEISSEASWQSLLNNRRQWGNLMRQSRQSSLNLIIGQPDRRPPRPGFKRPDFQAPPPPHLPKPRRRPPQQQLYVLLDAEKNSVHGKFKSLDSLWLLPINIDNKIVGYVGLSKLEAIKSNADKVFVAKQTRYFIGIAIIACVFAIVIAVFVASWMVSPIQRLVSAMGNLMQRKYDTHVSYEANDEIGSLVQSFNQLAKSLANHEHSQQQWIADISHELRTPLSTLKGELEALQDGIRPLKKEHVDSLYEEVLRLQRIVDDLHQLTLADLGAMRYRFSSFPVDQVINEVFEGYKPQLASHELNYSIDTQGNNLSVYADADRLYQLFSNLLQNSLRYTDKGGILKIKVYKNNEKFISIEWEDSAPNVEDDSLSKLFDRLYREEKSRDRQKGGSGLGLSICKSIVQSHSGRISAHHSSLGGLNIRIDLPMAKDRANHE